MVVEICGVGGYNEIGRNMTAIRIDDEVIICDMGIHLENYIRYTEEEDIMQLNNEELIRENVVPDITAIKDWTDMVKAIIPTHAHLDHIGAIPFLSDEFSCPILCTPFSKAVLECILKDERIKLKNRIIPLNPNSKFKISENITIEFIDITHSTPQTVMIAIHTKYGTIIYSNDFKFDRSPILGKPPNFEKIKSLGKKGVLCLIVDSTYAYDERKMPSEAVAKQMLKDVLLGTDATGKIIIITTFSSHLARLKTIIDLGKKLNRKILFLGRSLEKYVNAGEEVGIIDFKKDIELIGYKKQINKRLNNIKDEDRGKYLLVITGHQGEPKAMLSKIAEGTLDFKLKPEDHVIFSCTVIPAEINIENRKKLETTLKAQKVRIFKDIHVSGHAAREDLRDLLRFTNPKHIIPAHGEKFMTESLKELAEEMEFENIHLIDDKDHVIIIK